MIKNLTGSFKSKSFLTIIIARSVDFEDFLRYCRINPFVFSFIPLFNSFSELKKSFNSVDKVKDFYVFDLGGNKLRLIANIHFQRQKVYIRHILTHKEYDKDAWK